ncbi:MAG: helix-turn-helix transcriptional regulator [Candidatus Eisenbacteria bacterium]|uniref:Helix-turn-helix transcriptional regulator n=1 Tax=Eiseniibacteriota bacterium TaxID=2212470 RepID=A0A7Y2E5B4_UNCEI|nr:helix-turn-helix transcriptional regulator [Candidatus Eisenbacteria bacterium]
MARGYGQYCPLSLAAEVLAERWTILVISRVMDGCYRFNEIHRGLPKMSASLLSQRLRQLETAGVLHAREELGKPGYTYSLTQAGEDLRPLVENLAVWGQHWARDLTQADLDPRFLLWSMHLRLDVEKMPPGRTVLEFEFANAPADCRRFWIVNDAGKVEMCLSHPGFDVDLSLHADLLLFVETWRGFRDLRSEIRRGAIKLTGPTKLKRAFPSWLMLSSLSPFQRKRPGKERSLAQRRQKQRNRHV